MNIRHLLRMAKWARNPPSERMVKLVLGVIAVCLVLAGAEWLGLLPDWFGLPARPPRPQIQPLP